MRDRDRYLEGELAHFRDLLRGEPRVVKQRLNGYCIGLSKGRCSPTRVRRIKLLKEVIKTL